MISVPSRMALKKHSCYMLINSSRSEVFLICLAFDNDSNGTGGLDSFASFLNQAAGCFAEAKRVEIRRVPSRPSCLHLAAQCLDQVGQHLRPRLSSARSRNRSVRPRLSAWPSADSLRISRNASRLIRKGVVADEDLVGPGHAESGGFLVHFFLLADEALEAERRGRSAQLRRQ